MLHECKCFIVKICYFHKLGKLFNSNITHEAYTPWERSLRNESESPSVDTVAK